MPSELAVEATIRDLQVLEEEFSRSIRQRSPERLAGVFYAGDAQIHAPNHPPIVGSAAASQYWLDAFRAGLLDLKRETLRCEAEHDVAYSIGRYAMTVETHPGMLHTEKGKFLVLYHRQPDGSWRAILDSFSRNG